MDTSKKTPTIGAMKRKLEQYRDALAKRRDGLREMIDEIEALEEPVVRAIDDLERCIDALSEQA